MDVIRILLADDHRIFREGLKNLLSGVPGFSVAGEAEDGESAVRLAGSLAFDVAVVDLSMPVLNGIEATARILAIRPEAKVVALSMHDDKRFVNGALRAGATGYVLKDGAFEELVAAIRAVRAGKTYLTNEVGEAVLRDYRDRLTREDASVYTLLTPREREVLQRLAEGSSTKETASKLGVSVKTIETHRLQIMEKLGIRSVAELTKYAIREGLTTL